MRWNAAEIPQKSFEPLKFLDATTKAIHEGRELLKYKGKVGGKGSSGGSLGNSHQLEHKTAKVFANCRTTQKKLSKRDRV